MAVKPTSIILCGGKELRFGRSKAAARVGGLTVMERVLDVLGPISGQILLVTAPGKTEIETGGKATVVTDGYAGKGPLAGIHAGLSAANSEVVIAVACDMPFLNAGLLTRMLNMIDGFDAVVPRLSGEMVEPLHAIYSKSCLPEMKAWLERGELSLTRLLRTLHVRYLEREEYLPLDPRMLSFFNINYPEDFERANRIASASDEEMQRPDAFSPEKAP